MAQRKNIKIHTADNGDMVITRKRYVRKGNTDILYNVKCKDRITVVENEGVYCERTFRASGGAEVYCVGYLWMSREKRL